MREEREAWKRSAVLMGVVRQDVNRSAGRRGREGSDSVDEQAQRKMWVQS